VPIVRCFAAAALLLAGCAAAPRNEDLLLARSLVGEAREAGAALYAPAELDRATSLLSQAEEALRRNDTAQAKPLLDEASVDAQVALAKIGQPGARARLADSRL